MAILAITFAFLAAGAYSAWLARRAWQDPVNWQVDPVSHEATYRGWSDFGVASLVCGISSMVVMLGLTI